MGAVVRFISLASTIIAAISLCLAVTGCQTMEQRDARRGASDDATCKSYGLQFGTPQYAECRMRMQQQWAARDAMLIGAMSQSLANTQQNLLANRPVVTNCNSYMNSVNCTSQ